MSKKLIDERAILLFPSLAKEIGLNNAIFLQQLHFWCDIADELGYGKLHDGERWVYKTAQEWQQKDFPFWSVVTIRRIINSLHEQNLIHAMYLNDDKWNRTLFYRINHLHKIFTSDQIDNMQVINQTTCKLSNRQHASDQIDEMLSENTTEITSKITTDISNKRKSKFDPLRVTLPNNVNFSIWSDFVDMRKQIKKPLTERAANLILNKLMDFGSLANESLENSIASQWASVFPVKQNKRYYQQQQNQAANRMQEIEQLRNEWELNNESTYQPY